MYTFYAATYKLQTHLDEVLTEDEYLSRPPEAFLPNRHWFPVTIREKENQAKWIEAYNAVLEARWTPNQNAEDREYFQQQEEEAKRILASLEC